MTVTALLSRLNTWRQPPATDAPLSLNNPDQKSMGVVNRQLFQLAWPSLIENLLQTMLGVVDLIFVGQLGAVAIAGVGLGNQLMNLLLVLFMGLAVGNTALVARSVGAEDRAGAQQIAKQSLIIAAIISVGIALVGFFFADTSIALMGATPDVTALGGAFLRIVSVFSIFMGIMIIGGGTLRGAGDTRTPMIITGIINVINIFLDFGLIFGNFGFPRLGAIGSAVATTSARGIGAALILYVLFARGKIIQLDWRRGWRLKRSVLARILNIGWPSAAENVVFQLGFLAFSIVVIYLGTADLAAQQIAFNIAGFSILPAFAFGVAALTLVGQNLGAGDIPRAEASTRQAWKSGIVWMCAMGLAFFFGRHWLVGVYTTDPEVLRLGEMLMIFIAAVQPLQATAIVLGHALRGAGDTRATLVVTFIGVWIVRVGVGYLLGIVLGLGLFGVWLGWAADFTSRATLVWLRYRAGKWKTLKV